MKQKGRGTGSASARMVTWACIGASGLASGAANAQLDLTHKWANAVAATSSNDSVAAVGVDFNGWIFSAVNYSDLGVGGMRYTTGTPAAQMLVQPTTLGVDESTAHDIAAVDPGATDCGPTGAVWSILGGSYVGDVYIDPTPPVNPVNLSFSGTQRAGYALLVTASGGVLSGADLEPSATIANSAAEVLSVAVGPPCVACTGGNSAPLFPGGGAQAMGAGGGFDPPAPPPKSDAYLCPPQQLQSDGFVAIGGYFAGQVEFGEGTGTSLIVAASPGNEDAFVSLRDLEHLWPAQVSSPALELHLSSEGNERITAIDVSEHSARLAVTGYFSDGSLDFDPHATRTVTAPHSVSGTDIFVAVYDLAVDPTTGVARYMLRWLYTVENIGDDSGTGVAFDSVDNVYVTGWVENGSNGREIWMARINEFAVAPFFGLTTPKWEYVIGDDGDEAGLDVTVDHLDRPVFSGQFGRPFGEAQWQYCLDFDGTAGVASVCSAGGLDGFVARYYPTGTLDWAYAVGAEYDERVAGVDANRRYLGRLAYGGAFGEPSAPSGYQVDFNPHPSVNNFLATQGDGDGFVCASDPDLPTTVRSQVAIVLDANGFVADTDWADLVEAAAYKLSTAGTIPWDGTVTVTVLGAGSTEYVSTTAGPLIPWTPFTAETAPLFAQRLANTSRLNSSTSTNLLGDALTVAGTQMSTNGLGAGVGYRSILVVTNRPNTPTGTGGAGEILLEAARDNVLFTSNQADQINFLPVYSGAVGFSQIDRDYALDLAVESRFQVPALTGSHPLEDNLGFSGKLDGNTGGFYLDYQDPQLAGLLQRMFQRMAYCPGDFNRNGMLDASDTPQFTSGSVNTIPYADWNFDGQWDGHIPLELDYEKFQVSFNVVPVSIPCP